MNKTQHARRHNEIKALYEKPVFSLGEVKKETHKASGNNQDMTPVKKSVVSSLVFSLIVASILIATQVALVYIVPTVFQ